MNNRSSQMRKLILVLLIALISANLVVQPALADGALFPQDSAGYAVVRYHHVSVTIRDNQAITRVEQEFYNPSGSPIETRYLFPVHPGSILTHFQVTVDQQAQTVTRQDKVTTNTTLYKMVSQYRDPSLLQYVDWETLAFDLSLEAGRSRRMILEYEEVLIPSGGMYRYHYTLSTERYSSQPLETVAVTVDVTSSSELTNLYSPSHTLVTERLGFGHARLSWKAENAQPKEDFDLFFVPANMGFGSGLLTGQRLGQGHFMFLFSPQAEVDQDNYLPKDIVFVLDRSGSMDGEKIEQARNALRYFVDQLSEEDRFAIVTFNEDLTAVPDTLQAPSRELVGEMQNMINSLTAGGSTDLEAALRQGLEIIARSTPREDAMRMVVFLTDGLPTAGVIDEMQILRNVGGANQSLGARLHVFGVGYDVNTHLLDQLSTGNGGSVTYIQPGENLETVLTSFYDRIAHPVLANVEIAFEGLQAWNVYPQSVPDLFEGSSLLLTGKYTANTSSVSVRVSGRAGEKQQEYVYHFDLEQSGGYDFVPRLWATHRVGELLDRVRVNGETPELVNEIGELGLGYGIVTPYTSFIVTAQAEGAASQTNMNLYRDPSSLNAASGQVTIQARVQNQAYQNATQANLATGANILNQGNYSIAQLNDSGANVQNVDLSIFQGQKDFGNEQVTYEWVLRNIKVDRNVTFGSPEYFSLAANREIRPILQSGVNVLFAYNGEVIQVQDNGPVGEAQNSNPAQGYRSTALYIWVGVILHILELLVGW